MHFEANNDPKDAWKDFDISWMVATLDDLGYSCFIEAAKQKRQIPGALDWLPAFEDIGEGCKAVHAVQTSFVQSAQP